MRDAPTAVPAHSAAHAEHLARLRRGIRESSAEQVARSFAKRAVSRQYTAVKAAAAPAGLIATGRVASRTLNTGLIDDA